MIKQLITQPLVSIIMPTFNRSGFLNETVHCILSQTYENFELIIVDDCSTDETPAVLSQLAEKDSRIRLFRNQINMKHIKTLNRGLREAKGTYIARADDDDPWISVDKLARQVLFLEKNPEYVLVGTGAIVIDEQGKELFRYTQPETDKSIRDRMLFGNPFVSSTTLFRRSTLDKTGFHDENLKDIEDWDLWLRLGIYGKLYNFKSYDLHRFHGARGLSIKNRKNVARTRIQHIIKYRKNYPFFIPAFIFNGIQWLYTFLPYIKKLDGLLFKYKRKILMG